MRATTMKHQRGERGHTPLRESDTKQMTSTERRRSDVPVKPDRFSEKEHLSLGKIWDEFISTATWLLEADTPKAAMFCYLWRQYWKDPDAMPTPRIHQLRFVMTELGLDPLARARIDRADLPVRKHEHQDKKPKGKAAAKAGRRAHQKKQRGPGNFEAYT